MSADIKSTELIKQYRRIIYGGLLLIILVTLGNAIYLSKQLKQGFLDSEVQHGDEILQVLNQTISVSLNHIDRMRFSIESARRHPELNPHSSAISYLTKQNSAPLTQGLWDTVPQPLKEAVGQVFVASNHRDITFDLTTLLPMMPSVIATHQQHGEFQWSYYYDAGQTLTQLYPSVSHDDILAATGTTNMDDAIAVIYEAGGTFPLKLVSPEANPDKQKIWTTPYMDAGGKGMMISLLAPIYDQDAFVGAVGTDITLKVLSEELGKLRSKLGQFAIIDSAGTLIADNGGYLKGKTTAINQNEVLTLIQPGEAHNVSSSTLQTHSNGYWVSYTLANTPWVLVLEIKASTIQGHIFEAILPYLMMGGIFTVILLFIVLYQHWNFSQPALQLAQFVEELPEQESITVPEIPKRWTHWFNRAATTENDRRSHLKTIEKQTEELEQRVIERTQELQKALESLKTTQNELVHSEKLAGLGSLVAGVSHELNTPIGNALLVASSLRQFNQDFVASMQQGLRKSVLDNYIEQSSDSAESIEVNLHRAAELIASFKQVAVDQTSYQRRGFNLPDILHELRITMAPNLSRQQIVLNEKLSDTIAMDSYPGPLTQVLMNLLTNTSTHAFTNQTEKVVSITCSLVDETNAQIEVTDNGHGIAAENLSKIFEPFFTTRLGKGGSGLGLNIAYNIVTGLLGGDITVTSDKEVGTTFTLSLPLKAPEKEESEKS
ncbi:ATP-binding protein [uncultured Vibrio sp.]|uniref:sensor histidine kinase n=1 Tax=uncultured Vibrio sp. TaxID=114054 RepID=UPI0025F9FAEE|nr:ATP-binding protein [uncultured Vibrio sp.]